MKLGKYVNFVLAWAVTWWLHPFVLITPVIDSVTAVWAPKHDQSFTQLFKLSIGITTAAITSNVSLYHCHKSNSPLSSRTFRERGLNHLILSAIIEVLQQLTEYRQNNLEIPQMFTSSSFFWHLSWSKLLELFRQSGVAQIHILNTQIDAL